MASVWTELKRRNVVKVAVAYAIVGWLLIEVSSTVLPTFGAPTWVLQTITFVIILAYPLALIFAWAFEITPEGLKREKDVDREKSITHLTGQVLNNAIIVLLAVAVIFLAMDRFVLQSDPIPSEGASNSIAVLPFSNESAAAENAEFFANGIHDEILTQLSRIGALRVISRTSVMEYRDTTKNLRQIGAELGTATIVEGRVQRAGDRVRINVQLINAETDEHLWAEIYDRELTAENLFAIQSEVAVSIAEQLEATLTPEEVARLNEIPTQSTRAYDFYLSGLQYNLETDRINNLPLAIQQFERSTKEDPGFALAYVGLSRSHGLMYWLGFDATESRRTMSLAAARKALELQPDLPEAHWGMAYYHYYLARNFDAALRELDIAERGMPGDGAVISMRANISRRIGRWEEGLAIVPRIIELDPRNAQSLIVVGAAYLQTGLPDEAERMFERVLDLVPDSETARILKAYVYWLRDGDMRPMQAYADDPTVDDPYKQVRGWWAAYYQRDTDLALSYLADWQRDVDIGVGGEFYTPKSLYYAITYQLADDSQLAESYYEATKSELEELIGTNPDDWRFRLALAQVLAGLGDSDGAIREAGQAAELAYPGQNSDSGQSSQWLRIIGVLAVIEDDERVLRELDDYLGSRGGVGYIEGILPDPRLDFIRDDPRFLALAEKYRRR